MSHRLAQPSPSGRPQSAVSSTGGRTSSPATVHKPAKARILQEGFASESDMSPRTQSASGRQTLKDRAPASAPASSKVPASRPAASEHPEYTDESEDTRVRSTSSVRPSDPPESSSAEAFGESGETFVPETDASTDS